MYAGEEHFQTGVPFPSQTAMNSAVVESQCGHDSPRFVFEIYLKCAKSARCLTTKQWRVYVGTTADTIKRWYVNQRYKTHNEVVQRKNLWITLRRKSEDVDITRVPFDVELSTFVARFNPDECCLVINQGSEAANIETSSKKRQKL